jgi:hypothetical protein
MSKYQADPMAMFRVLNKVKPFNDAERLRLNLPVRISFESMKTGKGVDDDFHTLAAVVNVALICSESIDPAAEETAIRAKDALMRTLRRWKSTGKYGFDGPALLEIADCIDLHEQLIQLQTPLQMQIAMKEVIRRMDAGEIEV